MQRKCTVESCSRDALKRGWCNAHYLRWYKHGDPQGGGRATMEGAPLAWITDVAMRNYRDECLTWPFYTRPDGYGELRYKGRNQIASRVLCEKVYGPPPTDRHEAAHSCGKGHEGCMTRSHLRWATHLENQDDRRQHGTDGYAVWARWKAEGVR